MLSAEDCPDTEPVMQRQNAPTMFDLAPFDDGENVWERAGGRAEQDAGTAGRQEDVLYFRGDSREDKPAVDNEQEQRPSDASHSGLILHRPAEPKPGIPPVITSRHGLPSEGFSTLAPEESFYLRESLEGAAGENSDEWSEEVACRYEAELRLAILDYAERSSQLPGSKRMPISSSNDADLSETLSRAWRAMSSLVEDGDNPEIFQRNGDAVYLIEESGAEISRVAIRRHTPDSMRLASAEAIFWYSRTNVETIATGGEQALRGEALVPIIEAIQQAEPRPHAHIRYAPPSDEKSPVEPERWEVVYPVPHYPNTTVTRSMAASLPRGIRLPALEAVVEFLVLSRDGKRLLTKRGYHSEEGIFVDFEDPGDLPPVEECIRRIDELFGIYAEAPRDRPGFPFDSPASRAHLYACLLAGVIGPAVSKKPVFLFDKATPRTGATFMAETVSIILTGDKPTYVRASAQTRNSVDEMAKGLSAAASLTKGVVLMDNASGTLNDPEWNRYASSEVWEDRRLGRNDRTIRVSRRPIVDIITANNLQLTAESAARVCISRLDAGMEHPEQRLFGWVPQNRARQDRSHYVEAVVGLVAHWLEQGGIRERSLKGWGGFEEWRDVTAGILKAAGIEGFGQPVGLKLKDRLDDGGEHDFVQWWWETFVEVPVGAKELSVPKTVGDDSRELGILTAAKGSSARARATWLGSLLRSLQGKVYDLESGVTVTMVSAGRSNNRLLYRLRPQR